MLDPDQLRESGIALGQKVELRLLPGGGVALVAAEGEFEREMESMFDENDETMKKLAQ